MLGLSGGVGVSGGTSTGPPGDCVLGLSGGVGVEMVAFGDTGVVAVDTVGVGPLDDGSYLSAEVGIP